MSAATLTRPVCGRTPGEVLAPEQCFRCGGMQIDPEPIGSPRQCDRCQGGGWEAARFDLLPSRTFELRRVRYLPVAPGLGRLSLWCLKKKVGWTVAPPWVEYAVAQTGNEFGGRSFLVDKVGTGRRHNVILAPTYADCECEGRTYETSAKHNRLAAEAGGEVYPTLGCVHKDFCRALLVAGWFDLPGAR